MTKYVLANVDIPIKINEDGKIESLHSYAQIEIIKEIDSPEDIIKDLPSISDQIDKMFSKNEKKVEEEREPDVIVLKKDIKSKISRLALQSSLDEANSKLPPLFLLKRPPVPKPLPS